MDVTVLGYIGFYSHSYPLLLSVDGGNRFIYNLLTIVILLSCSEDDGACCNTRIHLFNVGSGQLGLNLRYSLHNLSKFVTYFDWLLVGHGWKKFLTAQGEGKKDQLIILKSKKLKSSDIFSDTCMCHVFDYFWLMLMCQTPWALVEYQSLLPWRIN